MQMQRMFEMDRCLDTAGNFKQNNAFKSIENGWRHNLSPCQPRMATSCCSKYLVKFFYGCHTTCPRYIRRNSNRLFRYCMSFFDICTCSTTSVRDSFDIVRDYYEFVRVYKSFARSVSSLYDIVRYTTTLVRN